MRKVVGEEDYVPTDPRELCKRIFVTCYMGTENSSRETRARADGIAAQIGSHHLGVVIDTVVSAVLGIFRSGQFDNFYLLAFSERTLHLTQAKRVSKGSYKPLKKPFTGHNLDQEVAEKWNRSVSLT